MLKVLKLAEKFMATRIYLGANRKDVKKLDAEGMKLLKSSGLWVVIETSPRGYAKAVECCPDRIVLRTEVANAPMFSNHLSLKIDNMKEWCAVAEDATTTDISGVRNGMYETDMEVDDEVVLFAT